MPAIVSDNLTARMSGTATQQRAVNRILAALNKVNSHDSFVAPADGFERVPTATIGSTGRTVEMRWRFEGSNVEFHVNVSHSTRHKVLAASAYLVEVKDGFIRRQITTPDNPWGTTFFASEPVSRFSAARMAEFAAAVFQAVTTGQEPRAAARAARAVEVA